MAKERMLTVLVPIKDTDATVVSELPAVDSDNINVIYKYNGSYYRVWLNPETDRYEYHVVVDREFPYIGQPLEIFNFTYDATRMGTAPVISAQNVMWYADKYANGQDRTLEDLWIRHGQECHVVFNGQNLYLKQIPTSGKTNEDARYKYDLDFVSEDVVLEHVYLYDVVQPFVTETPVSESSVFSFFGDINELAKRINASLLRSGLSSLVLKSGVSESDILTYKEWNEIGLGTYTGDKPIRRLDPQHAGYIYFYPHYDGNYNRYLCGEIYKIEDGEFVIKGYQCVIGKDKKGQTTTSDEKLLSFENTYIHDALNEFNDIFKLQYYITKEKDANGAFTGNTLIVVGDCEYDFADMNAVGTDYIRDADGIPTTTHPFDYGVDGALLSKEKTNTTESIVTKISGIGSTENIPWYYPNPTADGWIKPVFKIGGDVYDNVIVYPVDEGTTVSSSVLYEKYLKNRLGDVFQFGRKVDVINSISYKKGTMSSINADGNNMQLTYVIKVDDDCVNPKFLFTLAFLKDSNVTRFVVKLRDNTSGSTVIGEYDSMVSYIDPTDFQNAFISRDGSVSVALTAGHVYYMMFLIYFNVTIPTSKAYDYVGYHYNGRNAGYTTDYNQYYPGLSPNYRYVHIREDFYNEENLQEVGELFAVYYANNQHNIVIGYSVDGTPQTAATPLNRTQDAQYKDLATGVIYKCTVAGETAEEGFTANPHMGLDEWVSNYMCFELSVWSVDGWYKKSKKVELSDYGIAFDSSYIRTFDITDSISFRRLKYLTPCGNLMPQIYYKTDGERRFYGAINYPKTGEPDTDAGETIGQGGLVINPLYQKDNDGVHYDFENEIVESQPKERIDEVEDIKPTIKGQYSYYGVIFDEKPSDWSEIYTEYYIQNIDGSFSPAPEQWNAGYSYYKKVRIDVVEEFGYDELDNDEIWESNDGGNTEGEYKHPFFFAKLRPLGFNIFDLALQDEMVLSMTTGHCGSCKFKIGVDENTGKNPVQIWEHDVYGGYDYNHRGQKLYAEGELRRYVDDSALYYDTDGTDEGYIPVKASYSTAGFLVGTGTVRQNDGTYMRNVYSSAEVANGEVGTIKQEPKNHFEGDVKVSGRFIPSQQDTSESFVWVALYKDTDTYGTIMPSAKPNYIDSTYDVYIRPNAVADVHTPSSTQEEDEDNADKFVLTNIRLPQVYLRSAEEELSRKLIENMSEDNYQKFNFGIHNSRIFLAQNPIVDDNLNENSVVYVRFNNKIYRQYVKHYTYTMSKDAVLPDISVDMNEELSVVRTIVGRIDRMSRKRIERTDSRLNKEINRVSEGIMRRTLSRTDDALVSGNIVSRDVATSINDVSRDSVVYGKTIDDVRYSGEKTKGKTDEVIDNMNTFNQSVTEQLKRVRLTVEQRMQTYIGATQGDSCLTYRYNYDSSRHQAELLWVNVDGSALTYDTATQCPTDEGMTDITWNPISY